MGRTLDLDLAQAHTDQDLMAQILTDQDLMAQILMDQAMENLIKKRLCSNFKSGLKIL
tara:strand:- start:1877 stop:2050 length:174 start_codon:yes stop_codon:yes gene_type:complete